MLDVHLFCDSQISKLWAIMKILVINTGSSSIKYELFDMKHHQILASGTAEKIGEETGVLTYKIITPMAN